MGEPHGAALRLVIPAHAGIQVRLTELPWWIPAFSGMTEPERASFVLKRNGYFQRRRQGA